MMRRTMAALERLALGGDSASQYELARRLWAGDGVDEDRAAAMNWYRAAAESGNMEYQMGYGLVICWTADSRANYMEGFRWILKAAECGHPGAQHFVASEYANGENLSQNLAEAAKWYERAAESGHAEAQYNLSLMYFFGEGVPKSTERARELILAAGTSGELFALRALSEAYASGLYGFPKDQVQAGYWKKKYDETRR